MDPVSLTKLFKKYIKNTEEKSVVVEITIFLCKLTNAVKTAGNFPSYGVYITTKTLKHLYDKRPAEEFDAILKYLPQLIKYPDNIYVNKNSKRGSYCFDKKIRGLLYWCSVEQTADSNPQESCDGMNYVVTAFRIRKTKESYVDSYKLIWSWKGGIPSS
jgi:hypothetical protein